MYEALNVAGWYILHAREEGPGWIGLRLYRPPPRGRSRGTSAWVSVNRIEGRLARTKYAARLSDEEQAAIVEMVQRTWPAGS